MKIKLDNFGGYIELLDESFAFTNPVKWMTDLAAIARGNIESNNPAGRYNKLHHEAEARQPSRPFEFLPVTVDKDIVLSGFGGIATDAEIRKFMQFSYEENDIIYSNGRAMVEVGIQHPQPISALSIKRFAAFRAKVPMFSWAQILTHNKLSTESQSDRVTSVDDYWLPDDINNRLNVKSKETTEYIPRDSSEFTYWMIHQAPQSKVQSMLKDLGYPLEIYNRAPYYLKMKEFVITGWTNDDSAWPHFLRERCAYTKDEGIEENWTQDATKMFARAARVLLEGSGKITLKEVVDNYNLLLKRRKEHGYER